MGKTFWPGSAYEDDEDEAVVYGVPDAPNTEPESGATSGAGEPESSSGPGPERTQEPAVAAPGPVVAGSEDVRPLSGAFTASVSSPQSAVTPVRGVPVVAQVRPGPAPMQVRGPAPVVEDRPVPAVPDPARGSTAAEMLGSAPSPAQAARAIPLSGWRRGVRVVSGGLVRPRPSRQARELAADLAVVQVQLGRPCTVVVANPKGGGGKALEAHEPVLTPGGWRPIGSLGIHDQVIGVDGRAHRVLGVFPQGERELLDVRFSDGTVVRADGEHLWDVQTAGDRGRPGGWAGPECGRRLLTTAQLAAETLQSARPGRGVRHRFFVPVCQPVHFAPRGPGPVDPYLLGVLLGDGTLSGPSMVALTSADRQIVAQVARVLPTGVRVRHNSGYQYRLVRAAASGANPLLDALRDLGVMGHRAADKFVPASYLFGDVPTRTAVLQGLMDTDGAVRASAGSFTTVSARLAEDVAFLAGSLGCVVTKHARRPSYSHAGVRRSGQLAYTLHIKAPSGLELFRLDRKRRKIRAGQRVPYRAISSITPAGRGQAVCIKVAAPEELFLTRGFVATHNTPTVVGLSGTFGHHRGGRVLAWDNNETMGTLGIRTFAQPSATTAVDLLAALDHLAAGGARAGDIARFVRYQASGEFDVLVSDENPQRMSQIDAFAFRGLHNLLTTIYEVVVVDTGNNARASNFQAAIDVCDALVIPLAFKKDSVMSAGRLIDALRSYGRADLVERAVTVISGGPSSDQEAADLTRWRSFFEEQTAAVVEVPFDQHLAVGGPIQFDQFTEGTRRAYLRASARVAEVLSYRPGQQQGWPAELSWETK